MSDASDAGTGLSHADLVEENLRLLAAAKAGQGPRCSRPWTGLDEFHREGHVRPCVWSKVTVGSVQSAADIDTVWNGPRMQEYRRRMAAGDTEGLCFAHCPIQSDRTENFEKLELHDYTREELAACSARFLDNRRRVLEAFLAGATTVPARPIKLCDLDKDQPNFSKPWYVNGDLAELEPTLEELRVWGGEPLFDAMSRQLLLDDRGHPHLHRCFVTNGMIVSDRIVDALRRLRVGWIAVSLDSHRGEIHEAIRTHSRWRIVQRNLTTLIEIGETHPTHPFPVFGNFVIQARNFRGCAEFVAFAHERGFVPNFSLIMGSTELLDHGAAVEAELERALTQASRVEAVGAVSSIRRMLETLPDYLRSSGIHAAPSEPEIVVLGRQVADSAGFDWGRHCV
jgi:hypothetical protein